MTRLERRKSMKPQQRREIKAISGEGNIFRKIKHWAAPSRDSFGICAVRWRVIKLHPWPAFLFPKGKYHRSFALCGYNGCFDQVTLWSDYKHWPCERKWLQRKGEFNIDFTYHMNQIKFARTSNTKLKNQKQNHNSWRMSYMVWNTYHKDMSHFPKARISHALPDNCAHP